MTSIDISLLQVDPTGPLSNIRKLLLSGDIINKVKQFLTDKWWVAVLAAVGLFVLMVRLSI